MKEQISQNTYITDRPNKILAQILGEVETKKLEEVENERNTCFNTTHIQEDTS